MESVIQKTIRSSEGNLIGNIYAVDENSILVSCPLETEEQGTKYQKITYRLLMAIKYDSICKRQSLKDSRAVNLKILER